MVDRAFLANIKMLYVRGSSWIQFIFNLGVITANIKLFESVIADTVKNFGLTMQMVYPIAIIGYIILCFGIGLFDKYHGIWHQENDYTLNLTPEWKSLIAKVDYIISRVDNK